MSVGAPERANPVPGRDRSVPARLGAALRALRWYWSGVTGADAYERYVAHLSRAHPGCPVPTKRDFWREKYADQERNPTQRCC